MGDHMAHRVNMGLIFGGPSEERGISLNSARTVWDHLTPLGWDIKLYYCDRKENFHRLFNEAPLYSNTPLDFDFKLDRISAPLNRSEFIQECKKDIDIVFPVIHGEFGEDGDLQLLLEENHIPFVGSSSRSCRRMFNKIKAKKEMEENRFATLPYCCFSKKDDITENKIKKFFSNIQDKDFSKHIVKNKFVVKPSTGGSSIGIHTAKTPGEAAEYAKEIFDKGYGKEAMIEPFCKGREFTVIVLENKGNPVPLIPTEIRLFGGDIFTYRTKYLPSRHVEYHCPPRFNDVAISKIRKFAEKLFKHFDMHDFARIDGWLLNDGTVIFSDFNPISGMEQDSDMFIQGSRFGFTHCDILNYIVTHAIRREYTSKREDLLNYSKPQGIIEDISKIEFKPYNEPHKTKNVRVLFGGETSERQISVMSGTNVWLKLFYHDNYDPCPYIISPMKDDFKIEQCQRDMLKKDYNINDEHLQDILLKCEVWRLPYSFTLNYTVEEILSNCENASNIISRLDPHNILISKIHEMLELPPSFATRALNQPSRMSLLDFCKTAKDTGDFVFNALHGGYGENGDIQTIFNHFNIAYNGSGPEVSRICMDKYDTWEIIHSNNHKLLDSAKKHKFYSNTQDTDIWATACGKIGTSVKDTLIIKPLSDGCSTGVLKLKNPDDLKKYLRAIAQGQTALSYINESGKYCIIELPKNTNGLKFIIEQYINTDKIEVNKDNELVYIRDEKKDQGWIELTVGYIEKLPNENKREVMTPSITLLKNDSEAVLSIEDKFMGGTGVNITPPNVLVLINEKGKNQSFETIEIISDNQKDKIQKDIKQVVQNLGIRGYARIDIFFNRITDQTIIIEANTLPGLSPSTVLFQQACQENYSPQEFLSKIIELGINRCKSINNNTTSTYNNGILVK